MAKIAFEQLRFVVVDSNAHKRRIVRTLLRAFGCREIYEAEDGASGLEAVEAYSPDILLTDIMMPNIDGIELTRIIRDPDSSKLPFLPVIVLTACSEKKHVLAARDAGATEFLCKPVSATSLYRRVQNVVENPRQFVRTRTYFSPDRRRKAEPRPDEAERRVEVRGREVVDYTQAAT
jgi:two-component system, chemotaxis family, chemotaxis protein CheY